MNVHVHTLKPFGIPEGMDPRTWRQEVEKHLNELLDRAMSLITALDMMEAGTEDLEDGVDAEPWLGWGERGPRFMASASSLDGSGSMHDDRELDDADLEHSGDEFEPSLGWSAATDQNLALMDKGTATDGAFFDGEQDAGDEPEQPDQY